MIKLLGLHSLDGIFADIKQQLAMKMSISDIESEVIEDDSGITEVIVTYVNDVLKFTFRNFKGEKGEEGQGGPQGPQGPQGATSVYDSTTQDFLTTLETTTGQDQTKTMSQKAITDELDKYDKYINGTDKTVWELEGEIDYYSSGYANKAVMQHTKPLSCKFNVVRIGPVAAASGTLNCHYHIMIGPWSNANAAAPLANLTEIATGRVSIDTNFKQFDIELDNVYELDNQAVYVYFTSGSGTVNMKILGKSNSTSPSTMSGSYAVYYASNASQVASTWTGTDATKYVAVQPILRLVLPAEKNEDIDARIEVAKPSIVEEASAEHHDFVTDVDNTYKLAGEIEHYEQYGKGYASYSVAQRTKARSEDIKITSVVCGPVKTASGGSVNCHIVLTTNPKNYSQGTLLKSVNQTIGTSFMSFEVELDEEVTVPAGSVIAVYYMSGNGGNRTILGNNNTSSVPAYTNSQLVLYGGSTTSSWTAGNAGYIAVQPILKYHKDSQLKEVVNELIEDEKPELIEELGDQVGDVVDEKMPEIVAAVDKVEVYLPSKIVAVVGDTLELFWRSIIKAVDPYAYDVQVVCSKGSCYPWKYSYSPKAADVGSTTLTVKLRNGKGILVGGATTSLVTVAAPISPLDNVNVFCIGDSLTSGGVWPSESNRRLTNTNSVDSITGKGLENITFCGKQQKTLNDTTTRYYGRGGWTWSTFQSQATTRYRVAVEGVESVPIGATYSNNNITFTVAEVDVTAGAGTILLSGNGAPSASGILLRTSESGDAEITFTAYELENDNPFWDSSQSKFSFVPYVEEYGNGVMDVVYVLLSWNGQAAWKNYSASDTTGQIASAKTFIRKIRNEYPDAKVKIVGLQMPSVYGGLGYNYGCDPSYSQRYGLFVCAWNYNKALNDLCQLDEFSEYCEFVDVATQFDSENNFPSGNWKINKRNSATRYAQQNGVHPSDQGYRQIADVIYRNFVANYCQG